MFFTVDLSILALEQKQTRDFKVWKTFFLVSCPKGTVQVNKECVSCPIGSKPSKKLKRCQDCSEPGAFSPGKMKCGG